LTDLSFFHLWHEKNTLFNRNISSYNTASSQKGVKIIMQFSWTMLSLSIIGTAPIILTWALGSKRWLIPAILLSALIAVGFGDPLYHVIDLASVAVVGLLAYVSLDAEESNANEEWT
jgi:hypothetical protein